MNSKEHKAKKNRIFHYFVVILKLNVAVGNHQPFWIMVHVGEVTQTFNAHA